MKNMITRTIVTVAILLTSTAFAQDGISNTAVNNNLLKSDAALKVFVAATEVQKNVSCNIIQSETSTSENKNILDENSAEFLFSTDFHCKSNRVGADPGRILVIHVAGGILSTEKMSATKIETYWSTEAK